MNSRWELAETYHLLNQKKYNGKEWVNDMNLGQLLYGKRPYNPILGRFESTDPISHMFPSLSGYNYASNNPIRNIDLHGLQGVDAVAGALVGDDNKGYIKTASKTLREDSPRLAGLQDAAFAILDFIGFNHIDNVYFGDQPTTTAEKVAAVVPLLFNTRGTVDEGAEASLKANAKPQTVNKNSNNAEGNYVLYEINDVNGKPLKVGKADADRKNASGFPVRMRDSERKAQKNYPGARGSVIPGSSRKTTTGEMKEFEAQTVKEYRKKGNDLPLNKEKDKKYNINN